MGKNGLSPLWNFSFLGKYPESEDEFKKSTTPGSDLFDSRPPPPRKQSVLVPLCAKESIHTPGIGTATPSFIPLNRDHPFLKKAPSAQK
uniref:Uncharacterized protein n=1 Tax=Acrobeloides nanus TaxID=290746 RepID=A0A914CU63_9BILA